jgi:hypothetical protein
MARAAGSKAQHLATGSAIWPSAPNCRLVGITQRWESTHSARPTFFFNIMWLRKPQPLECEWRVNLVSQTVCAFPMRM